MIPREIIEEVRDRNDIEQVIGSYVALKNAGSNVKGLCPFHNEKTPSFTVYPSTQSFYCYGCGAGGDVITFIMKYNNLDYVGAVEYLANRVGITIPNGDYEDKHGVSRKRVLEMNLVAAKYFREQLVSPNGAQALDYLTKKRRLSTAAIRHFGLGFAPNHPYEMLQYMRSQGFTDEELTAGYLQAIGKTGKPYSIFRNRIMFPIIDTSGNVIAFGGRVMDDSKPKYLNTNDTPAYKKGKNLFALNFAKDTCAERIILCEGYMDVIALHNAGFTNSVAGLGTALTAEQARLIAKYTKNVVLTYDSDEAGQKATERALQIFGEIGLKTKVLVVNGAKDPDEFILKFGRAAFEKLIDGSKSRFSYRAAEVLKKHDIEVPDEKISAAREICEVIANYPSSVERDICLEEASGMLQVDKTVLSRDVDAFRRRFARINREKMSQNAYASARALGDKVNPDAAKNVGISAAEDTILGLLLGFPEHRDAVASGKVELSSDDFFTALGKRVFEKVMELHASEGGFDMSLLGEFFSPDEMGRIQKMLRTRLSLSENGGQVLALSVKTLKDEHSMQIAKTSGDGVSLIEARRAKLKDKKNT